MEQYENQEVALEDMLFARERRVNLQNALISSYHVPVISFTLNIPGPVKILEEIPSLFERGCREITEQLIIKGIPILHEEIIREKTGYEAFYSADASSAQLKQMMTALEDGSLTGRLYDIDIIMTDGNKVSRKELGLPQRTCLICGEPAHACSRSRRHSVSELTERIREMLKENGSR